MTLGAKQELFTRCLRELLRHILDRGFDVRMGQVERSVEEATRLGKPNSIHTRRLAADLHVFRDGVYLADTAEHEPFGIFWEQLHPSCRWGGRFGDGNHYSLEHEGVR